MSEIMSDGEMRGEGWKKELTLKKIIVRGDIIICEEYDFFADKIACTVREYGVSGPQCGSDFAWVKVLNGKIFWACARHKIVNGPLSLSLGTKYKEYPVDPAQAEQTCREMGQKIPKQVKDIVALKRTRKTGYRRPSE